VAESQVGLVRVETGVLEGVGVQLLVETDATALLAEVEQLAAGPVDPLDRFAKLRAAVAALAAEHVPGEAFAVRAHQRNGRRNAEFQSEVLPAVDEPAEAGYDGRGRVAVRKP
jgi:hypothetical protein